MNKIIFITIVIANLFSCENHSDYVKNNDITSDTDSLDKFSENEFQTIFNSRQNEMNIYENEILYDEDAPVTQLPFGPNIKSIDLLCETSSQFYYEIVGKESQWNNYTEQHTKSYKLPAITTYKYIMIDSVEEMRGCNFKREDINKKELGSIFKITKFKRRLPDYGKFKIYYMSNDLRKFQDFSEDFPKNCTLFTSTVYGMIILYNPEKKSASLLPVYLEGLPSDSQFERVFYINEEYKISVCDVRHSYDEISEDEVYLESSIQKRFEVSITLDGEFIIKKYNY